MDKIRTMNQIEIDYNFIERCLLNTKNKPNHFAALKRLCILFLEKHGCNNKYSSVLSNLMFPGSVT